MGLRPLLEKAGQLYDATAERIYWKGIEMGGRNRIGLKFLDGPDYEPFNDILTYVGGTLMPRARQVALTPIRVPEHFRLRRQE